MSWLGHSAKLRLHKFKRIAKATKTFCGESVAWNLRCWRWTSKAFRASFQKKLDQISPPCVCIKFPGDPSGRKAKETPFTQRPLCARKSWSKTMQTRWKGIKAVKALEVFQKFYLEHLQTFRILQMLCFKDNLKLKNILFWKKDGGESEDLNHPIEGISPILWSRYRESWKSKSKYEAQHKILNWSQFFADWTSFCQ